MMMVATTYKSECRAKGEETMRRIATVIAVLALAVTGVAACGQTSTTKPTGTPAATSAQQATGTMSASDAVDYIIQADPGYLRLFQTVAAQYASADQYRADFDAGWDLIIKGLAPDVQAQLPDPDAVFNELLSRTGN
jgi:hypothetical protein